MSLPNPVIVIPGITATYLRDQYPIPPEIVWAVLKKDFGRSALHPDNLKYEAKEPARIVSDQLYEIAYEELIEELRYNLSKSEDKPVPVYPFGYDWRQPLDVIEAELADFVEEVIERTKLMQHYDADKYGNRLKVNLVGHSMGGLIVGGYLDTFGGRGWVEKVATLASPFQGSFEAVIKVTTGTANLGTSPPSSRERETARLTPALYHLIPSFKSGLVTDPGLGNNLFNPALWQPSIIETLMAYIDLHGVPKSKNKSERREKAKVLFKGLLDAGKRHRRRLDRLDIAEAGLEPKDWLCVVGVNAETRVVLKVVKRQGKPDFEFQSTDRANRWEDEGATEKERRRTGDGTVPFEGAIPKFLPYDSLVCLAPDDFGYWEIGDKLTTKVAGFHGILPNMNVAHRLIVRHFTGRPDRRGNTWGRPPPGVKERDWNPPLTPLRSR